MSKLFTDDTLNQCERQEGKNYKKNGVCPLHYWNTAFVETEGDYCKSEVGQVATVQEDSANHEAKEQVTPIFWGQIFGAFSCAFVHLNVGVVIGYTGITLPSMMDPDSEDLILTQFQAAIFSSVVSIGAIFGSAFAGIMAIWFGQRNSLLIYMPLSMVSSLCIGLAPVFWVLILGRLGQGIVMGASSAIVNNYVVEIVHPSVRGRLTALTDTIRMSGIVFVYLTGSTDLSWRAVILICGIVSSVIPFISLLFLPHSPRWLATRGRREEAEKSLTFFRGSQYDVNSELNEILDQLNNKNTKVTLSDQLEILRQRTTLRKFCIMALIILASNFNGNISVTTYNVTIFESANVSINLYLSSVIIALMRVIGSVAYLIISDKFGRRRLFILPFFLGGVCMFSLGAFFYAKLIYPDVSSISWLPLVSLVLFALFTCMGSPVILLWSSELFPNSIRSLAAGVLYLLLFLGSFGVTMTFPIMVESIGSHWTFWLYGMATMVIITIAGLFIPETQGRALEEIDKL